MNALADPFKQLVERKLWPFAVLLVALLAAVPMLLRDDASTTPAAAPASPAPVAEAADASVVTLADAGKRDQVRAVLGSRKDPFRPAQVHHVKPATNGLTTTPSALATTAKSAGSGETSAGAGTGGGAGATEPTVAAPTATPTPAPTFDLYSLTVRFGSTDGELSTRNVKRLTGLPGGTNPAALYLGLLSDHKSAVFIVDAGVEVLGDGHCDPTPEDCQTLTLKKGETEFLTRGDKQWELDLVDIHVKQTTDAAAARASRRAIAADGRHRLKGFMSRVGRYRYDERAGALAVVSKAKAARSSRTARFTSTG